MSNTEKDVMVAGIQVWVEENNWDGNFYKDGKWFIYTDGCKKKYFPQVFQDYLDLVNAEPTPCPN